MDKEVTIKKQLAEFLVGNDPSSESSMAATGMEKDNHFNPFIESKGLEICNNVENPSMKSPESSSTINPVTSQMTIQAAGYDPNRIPTSIFTSKPATPMEWSVASNESLFSIHIGNNSFSRDHVFLMYRSGEFPKLDETNNILPPDPVNQAERKSQDLTNFHQEFLHEPDDLSEFNPRADYVEPEKAVFPERAIRAQVDEVRHSFSSTHSFQFPLLEGKVGGEISAKAATENRTSPRRRQYDLHRLQPHAKPPKSTSRSNWFPCFSCCSSHGC